MTEEHWKTRRIPQVKWIIDGIYNKLEGKVINATRVIKLGDELDKEWLLHMSPKWTSVKEGRMTSKEMFQTFKNKSVKSFTTREIYVRWLHAWDKMACNSIQDSEMQFILENLRNRKKYCTLEKLNNKGMIAKETSSENMYCTLSSAFAETPHAIEQIIRDEVEHKKTIQYSAFDKKNWTANPESWDPLVFYVCANKFKCIVSIQADDTEEFRIYPDILPVELIVKFGQLNQSEFVYLKSNRKIFDAMNVIGFFCGNKDCIDCSGMEKHLQGQLRELNKYSGTQRERRENPRGEQLMNQHTEAVNGLLVKNKETDKDLDEKNKVIGEIQDDFQKFAESLDDTMTWKTNIQKKLGSIVIKPRPGGKHHKMKAEEEVTDSDVIDSPSGNTVQVKGTPASRSRVSESLPNVEDTPKPKNAPKVDHAFNKL